MCCMGLAHWSAGVEEQGVDTRGFSGNLGDPDRLQASKPGRGDRLRTPGPRLSVLDRWERNDRRSAWYCQAKATKCGERDTGSRTSS